MALSWNQREIAVDEGGYLSNADDWCEDLAAELARRDGLGLDPGHWRVLDFLRGYYRDYQTVPPMRLLVKSLADLYGKDFGNSLVLYRLFPDGPLKQASRYAGLPRPESCV